MVGSLDPRHLGNVRNINLTDLKLFIYFSTRNKFQFFQRNVILASHFVETSLMQLNYQSMIIFSYQVLLNMI